MAQRHKAVVSSGKTNIKYSTITKTNIIPTKTTPTTYTGMVMGWFTNSIKSHKQTLAVTTANGKNAFMRRRLKKLSKYAKCVGRNSSLKFLTPKNKFNLALVRMTHKTN